MFQGLNSIYSGWSIPPLIGNPYNEYINAYYWVDEHPLTQGTNWSLDPSTCVVSLVKGYESYSHVSWESKGSSPMRGLSDC